MRLLAALLALTLLVTASGPVATGAQTGATIGAAADYLVDDEFDGTAVDNSVWSVLNRGGDASNHEAQCYVPGNVTEGGGNLVITSKVDSSCAGYRYTSGMVQWTTTTFTYGTIEIRAKESGGQGSWPAQWLLGAKCQVANLTTDENVGGCNWPNPGSDESTQRAVVPTGPMFLIINNAMGGDGGGRIDAGDFPQTMLVDYVRVKKP